MYAMAKFEALVLLLQLPLIVLLLHWHTASATAAASGVTPRGRWSLGSQQLTTGGDFGVRVDLAPAPGPSHHLLRYEQDGQMSPQQSDPPPPPLAPLSPPPPSPQEPEMCNYKVNTQTGTQWTAGTRSTISVRFSNNDKDSIFMVLTKAGLDAGHLDEFNVQGSCIHDICKMELSTDASGYFPCWFAEYVSVSVKSPEFIDSQMFPVNEWLPAHEWSPPTSIVRDQCH